MKPRLAQWHQSGATHGQVAAWDEPTERWIPADAGAAEVLVKDGTTPPESLTTEDETDYLYEG